MKIIQNIIRNTTLIFLLTFLPGGLFICHSFAQSTAFTYQGQLIRNGAPANGTYDFRLQLYTTDTAGGGTRVAGPVTNSAVAVSNGLFTTTIDFGPDVFNGSTNLWLQIGVHTNGASGWAGLSPRQQITAAPYAIMAISASSLPGLSIQANTYGAPNVIEGAADNYVSGGIIGATIGGGGGTNSQFFGGNIYSNSVTSDFSTVGGGVQNTAGGGGDATVAGGGFNTANGQAATIGGGDFNSISQTFSTIAGGDHNQIQSDHAFIGGGNANQITSSGSTATIGGGYQNQAGQRFATVPGGANNLAGGQWSFAAGQRAKALNDGAFVWADSQSADFSSTNNDSFNVRAQGGVRFVTSGAGMTVDGPINGAITIQQNSQDAPNVIEGSSANFVSSGVIGATISGGGEHVGLLDTNRVTGDFGTVSGGTGNTAGGYYATVSGGWYNTAGGSGSFVGGGGYAHLGGFIIDQAGNNASGSASVIGGGVGNTASGVFSTVPGGSNNIAQGTCSIACGEGAVAQAANTFVWADGEASSFVSGGIANTFSVRATGGVYLWSAANASGAGTAGVVLNPGATSWTTLSDRNAKKNFQPVNYETVLDKLAKVPVEKWNYKWEKDSDTPNIGPMAQDFKHTFYPGRNDKGITTLEFDGVELAAIKGLNEKLREESKSKDLEIQQQSAEIQSLQQTVGQLKNLVNRLAQAQKGDRQ